VSKVVQVVSRICADIDPGNLNMSVDDSASKSDWNSGQIGACIIDLTSGEDPLEGIGTASPCASFSQYQPQSGQYQTPPCEPGLGDQAGQSTALPTGCLPQDVAASIEEVLPTGLVIGIAIPLEATCAASPVGEGTSGSSASSPASSGVAPAAVPSFPASPISQPLVEPAPVRLPTVETSKPEPRRAIRPAEPTGTHRVPAVTAAQPVLARDEAVRPESRVAGVEKQHRRTRPAAAAAPTSSVEALHAARVRTASGGPSDPTMSAWLAAAAVLLLFGLASFATALAGIPRPGWSARLRHIGLRASSKGLSGDPFGGRRGIRYRD
jgi:hypothetical protein